ncbi:protein kinase domain-containing protein [Actinophytocola sp.]|uniref:serine/threonine-protein kinase n=1 Tax=Actinophytocola sp. TaxID=1872138 RepID=UPI003D6C462B
MVAGRYRLLEQVGSGAMGVVWKAEDERLGRTVAIKRLLVRYAVSEAQSEETRRRAMREARIAARLQHRNAIAMFDVAEHEGDPCLVMEFLPSRSLSAVLTERGTLPPEEVAEIGKQVASALAAAHAVGIVHRDVKPGNILLADNGTVKITDFGISKALDEGTVTTQTGIAGTPAYLAPEIARGGDPSRASDVYSLGSTLYHAVEGRPPFGTNSNPLALLHAVASGNVRPPHNAGPLADTLSNLMRPDPATRPTMVVAAAALANPAAAKTEPMKPTPAAAMPEPTRPVAVLPAPAPHPTRPAAPATTLPTAAAPPPRTTDPSRRNLAIVAFTALLVVAGVVAAILMLNNDRKSSGNASPGGAVDQSTAQRSEPPEPSSTTTPSPSDDASTSTANEPIEFSEAGELVIAYYGDVQNTAERFAMLSGNAQAQFGGQDGFRQYWSQFSDVSSQNAQGVTKNADGSVNVPVDVSYTKGDSSSEQDREVRVTREDGKLVIDSKAT